MGQATLMIGIWSMVSKVTVENSLRQ